MPMKKITVIIPAFNEEKHIAKVIECIRKDENVDEIIVVDNNSADKTAIIANALGVKTILCKQQGKGYAMEMGLQYATNDYILFADADICNYQHKFVKNMMAPLINDNCDLVKATFEREGGRITELVAKPLLELVFPELAFFEQPLSGIVAGKKELFNKITFEKDYGVDIGILIDSYLLGAKIEQVNIGKILNDSQDWKDLTHMARQVAKAILHRTNINVKKDEYISEC